MTKIILPDSQKCSFQYSQKTYISSFSQGVPIYADSPYIRNTYALSKYQTITPDAIAAFKIFATAINGLEDKDVRISKRVNLS